MHLFKNTVSFEVKAKSEAHILDILYVTSQLGHNAKKIVHTVQLWFSLQKVSFPHCWLVFSFMSAGQKLESYGKRNSQLLRSL